MLNQLADEFIDTIRTDLNWFRQNGKLLIPFLFLLLTFAGAAMVALSIIEKTATEDSFFMQIVEFAAGYFTFSLLYFPVVIITNLWSLHLVKQLHEQQPVNVLSAFFKSIGLKFFLLIPLMFVWMFFQMLFAFFILIIGVGIALSRGHVGSGAVGKLFQGITIVSVMLQSLLFVVTPGMVFDNLGSISSFRVMRENMKRHFGHVRKKIFYYIVAFTLLHLLLFHYPGKFLNDYLPLYTLYGGLFLLLAFIYLIQLKAGRFYLRCKREKQSVFPGH